MVLCEPRVGSSPDRCPYGLACLSPQSNVRSFLGCFPLIMNDRMNRWYAEDTERISALRYLPVVTEYLAASVVRSFT